MTQETALMFYKGTILPIIEYADFVFDFNIKCQHFLPYDQKDSTETLHRQAK